jgi:hypothetical protein
MGAELRIVASFPDGDVLINLFEELDDAEEEERIVS